MCIVSDKLKFCSCGKKSIEDLPNHWVLHRYTGNQGACIIGEAVVRFNRIASNQQMNIETIRRRLHEPDAFDFKLKFKEKDRMELVITVDSSNRQYLFFCFEFTDEEWTPMESDPFDLEMHYKKVKKGKIESPDQLLRLDSN